MSESPPIRSARKVTFVVAVNNREILNQNLLASPCLQGEHGHQILLQEGYSSAARAYNHALDFCLNEVLVFVHQDIFLPETWLNQFNSTLNFLEKIDPTWGVLGCWGLRPDGKGFGFLFTSGYGVIGASLSRPEPVQTLDEVLLVVRRSSGLRFSESVPDFHLYGTDICIKAASRGMKCYAIPAFCIHNTRQYVSLPKEFYGAYKEVKKLWRSFLPIQASCIRITRFDHEYYYRKFKECYKALAYGANGQHGRRERNPLVIWSRLKTDGII